MIACDVINPEDIEVQFHRRLGILGSLRRGSVKLIYLDRRGVNSDMGFLISKVRGSHRAFKGLGRRGYTATSVRAAEESPSHESTSRSAAEQQPFSVQVKSRGVLGLDGPDVLKFLQGLVTNDVSRLMNGPGEREKGQLISSSAMYTAILNPQGRFLYDLFLYRPYDSTGETGEGVPFLLADVDASLIDEVTSHLTRHRLRAKVGLQSLSGELAVWQRFGGVAGAQDTDVSSIPEDTGASRPESNATDGPAQVTAKTSNRSWCWYRDPRLAELGLRGVFPSNSIPPSVTSGLIADESQYQSWRLDHGVPEGSSEIPKGDAIPLEFNLAGLGAISFDKGCYVGQELIARTHHRGVIRKRVMPIQFSFEAGKESEAKVPVGADILDTVSKKKVGKVTTSLGTRGLGVIRLDSALTSSAQLKLNVPDSGVQLHVMRPKWWPREWGGEDLEQTAAHV